MASAEAHLIRADLPAAPHRWIDDCLLAATIGRGVGHANDPLGLLGQQRQRDGSDTLDLQRRGQKLDGASDEEIAGPTYGAEQRGEFGGEEQHGRDTQDVGDALSIVWEEPWPGYQATIDYASETDEGGPPLDEPEVWLPSAGRILHRSQARGRFRSTLARDRDRPC